VDGTECLAVGIDEGWSTAAPLEFGGRQGVKAMGGWFGSGRRSGLYSLGVFVLLVVGGLVYLGGVCSEAAQAA
jgi:hypothetical protein